MLTNKQFLIWHTTQHLSEDAIKVIRGVRDSGPSRRTQSTPFSRAGRYPSRKMGISIQFESHSVELPAIRIMENDPDTLEFWDQPPPIKLSYISLSGRPTAVYHTPDYFLVNTDAAGWDEWKDEDRLLQLAKDMPNRYVRTEDGRWRCPPGEAFAEKLGLFYRIRSSAEIDRTYVRNLLFLEDYLRAGKLAVDDAVTAHVRELVTGRLGITLAELAEENILADDLHRLIMQDEIYVDLIKAPLSERDRVHVYRDKETAAAYADLIRDAPPSERPRTFNIVPGTIIQWDGNPWVILNPGETAVVLEDKAGNHLSVANDKFETYINKGNITACAPEEQSPKKKEFEDLLKNAHPNDLRDALYKKRHVDMYKTKTVPTYCKEPSRTIRYWVKQCEKAIAAGAPPLAGLLPKVPDGRQQLLDGQAQAIDETIKDYLTYKQKSIRATWGVLDKICRDRGIPSPSYTTFRKHIRKHGQYKVVFAREGRRAAHTYEPFLLRFDSPPHGERAFELAHLDHTQLDIVLVNSRTKLKFTARPWVTFLIDAYTRRILAIFITFDEPSFRSDMMVLRECVRLYKRLPDQIMTDGGSDFKSVYYETLLDIFEVTKIERRKAKARDGSELERLFGSLNTQVLYNFWGNTQITKDVRKTTKENDPYKKAIWTLTDFYEVVAEWAYEIYDTIPHPILGQSPRDAFALSQLEHGKRDERYIAYDDDFLKQTMPSIGDGTARVQPGGRVKINYIYYSHRDLQSLENVGADIPVRYDPFDIGIAFAQIKRGSPWVKLTSQYPHVLGGRSERELQIAVTNLRQQYREHGQTFTVTARKIAEFILSKQGKEKLLEQRLNDQDMRDSCPTIGSDIQETPRLSDNQSMAESSNHASDMSKGQDTAANPPKKDGEKPKNTSSNLIDITKLRRFERA